MYLGPLLRQVGGKVAMDLTMPTMLAWVLGGNADKLRFQDRAPHCRLPDKPKTFHEQVLPAPATGCTCKLHVSRNKCCAHTCDEQRLGLCVVDFFSIGMWQ